EIKYNLRGITNVPLRSEKYRAPRLDAAPVSYEKYIEAFHRVTESQRQGDSYLVNLTFPSLLLHEYNLGDIFYGSIAPYRLYYRGEFVVFSPETFVTIRNGIISSFPMKGTIDAALPKAVESLLNDEKERAEHLTIVDLLRNDLGMVARNVRVERFMYTETIRTSGKNLIQASSEICGDLGDDYYERIGDIIWNLLPAGSVSGAPKKRTLEIIRDAEEYARGYYTGVFGVFDGENLDSAVMIRFIERKDGRYYYRSGGGITVYSDPEREYRELIDKIYVPTG
ncbi:MAG TPA: aminodeoxychorismate synthase component I, partial [Spirochaetota bacterium]|nr:aminodeoxychorismate synthase component I [Spirochaetota bacterium]